MDCKNARLLLEFTHPGGAELDAADAEALHQHLADCPDCAVQSREERRADEHLGRAMRAVPVPPGLRERLLKRVADERDVTNRRRLLRWLGGSAAAAAVLAVVFLGYQVWLNQLPAVSGNDVYAQVNNRAFSDREVEEGFGRMGVTMKAPPRFNYGILASYGLAVIPGHQGQPPVPQLLFVREQNAGPPVLARVYVLSDRQFDLEKTRKNGGTFPSGTYHVKLEDFGEPHYLYLVVHNGDSERPYFFLRGTEQH